MVISILRYVSPSPWGSYRAESFRSSASLQRIASNLWSDRTRAAKPFSAGAGVLWTPVFAKSGELDGWSATRLPPYSNAEKSDTGVLELFPPGPTESQITELLFDRRFRITINWKKIPDVYLRHIEMGWRLMIVPQTETRFFLPKIVLRHKTPPEKQTWADSVVRRIYNNISAFSHLPTAGSFVSADWARWEFIRKISVDRTF
jgi:tRNA(Ile)-lysidine synthase